MKKKIKELSDFALLSEIEMKEIMEKRVLPEANRKQVELVRPYSRCQESGSIIQKIGGVYLEWLVNSV